MKCLVMISLLAVLLAPQLPAQTTYGDLNSDSVRWNSETLDQQISVPRSPTAWYNMFLNVPRDWAHFGRGVISSDALPSVVGLSALTGGLIATDTRTFEVTKESISDARAARQASKFFLSAGDGRAHAALALGFGTYGWLAHDSRAMRVASQTIESLLASGILVQVLKRAAGRESPEVTGGRTGRWRFFPNWKNYQHDQPRYYAFPSGHIATTMSTVTVLVENYPEIGWIRPLGYTVVGLVGVSLVGNGYHWYSDLPLGIAIGYGIGKIVSRSEPPIETSSLENLNQAVWILPSVTPWGSGVLVAMKF